jgi:F0F1-type ATP synthase delta subunit
MRLFIIAKNYATNLVQIATKEKNMNTINNNDFDDCEDIRDIHDSQYVHELIIEQQNNEKLLKSLIQKYKNNSTISQNELLEIIHLLNDSIGLEDFDNLMG